MEILSNDITEKKIFVPSPSKVRPWLEITEILSRRRNNEKKSLTKFKHDLS